MNLTGFTACALSVSVNYYLYPSISQVVHTPDFQPHVSASDGATQSATTTWPGRVCSAGPVLSTSINLLVPTLLLLFFDCVRFLCISMLCWLCSHASGETSPVFTFLQVDLVKVMYSAV